MYAKIMWHILGDLVARIIKLLGGSNISVSALFESLGRVTKKLIWIVA